MSSPLALGQSTLKQDKIAAWTGDDFTLGHKMRGGYLPGAIPASAERTVDFVIVGGGIGGLASAYNLRDHNILLLEQYNELGGQARGGSFKDTSYSYGSSCIASTEGQYGELYSELGLQAHALPASDEQVLLANGWSALPGTDGKFYDDWKKFFAESESTLASINEDDSPALLCQGGLMKLEGDTFAASLAGYGDQFNQFMNSYLRFSTNGTADMVSALAGYRAAKALVSKKFAFTGGNQALALALKNKLKEGGAGRCLENAFVWRIELKEGGASVIYSGSEGKMHRVDCRHVICAAPPMVAWRIMSNLDDKMKANLMGGRMGSYLIANLLLNKPVFSGGYRNWLTGAAYTAANITIAQQESKGAQASVLNICQPYAPGTPGRQLLLQGDRLALATAVVDQLSHLIEKLEPNLEQIVLTRWGHAIAVPTPGYYGRMSRIQAAYKGPYSLAHSSIQGQQSVESAIRAGRLAANRALGKS